MYGPGKAPPRQPRAKAGATARAPPPAARPKATRQSYTDYERVAVTVSEFLSKKYAHLDDLEEGSNCKRHRGESWPDLERALAQWFIIKSQQGEHVGGDALKKQAKWFWDRLPQYRGVEEPPWSNGWLQGFKARRGIIPHQRRPRKRKDREEDETADSSQAPQQSTFGMSTDNAEQTMPHVRHMECLQAIQTLRLYEQQQKDCQTVFLHALDGYEKVVRTRLRESLEPNQPSQPNQMETFFPWD
ncbi:hypothetical protein NU219Hw_g5533t1 [Hortaea werneckii]